MAEYTCKYCNSTFTAKPNLNRHLKKSGYCLQARGLEKTSYMCTCGKKYTRSDSLQRHQLQCQNLGQSGREDALKDQVIDLQRRVIELSMRNSQPTATKNTARVVALNNLQPITDEVLKEHLDKLTLDKIMKGLWGYASYAKEYPFKDKIFYTDPSRRKMRYKDANEKLTRDDKELARRFFEAIHEHNTALIKAERDKIIRKIDVVAAKDRTAEINFNEINDCIEILMNMELRSKNAARGKDDEFIHKFLVKLARVLNN